MAILLSAFKQTPVTVLLTIAAPVLLIVTFTWYATIFGALRSFINERLPESERLSRFSERAISVCLGVPALICFAMQMIGQTPNWVVLSFIPIGTVASTVIVFGLQQRLAKALLVERESLLEDSLSFDT
jgi:maltodextrin utilization protein YvdJ